MAEYRPNVPFSTPMYLFIPQYITAKGSTKKVYPKDGELISILATEVVRNTWYIIVIFSALGIIREIVKLLDGKYTGRVVITTVITDLLSALCSFWWLLRKDIINPEFAGKIGELFEGDGAFITEIFSHFQYFFLGVILFALLLDIMNAVIKGIAGKE